MQELLTDLTDNNSIDEYSLHRIEKFVRVANFYINYFN